MPSKLAMAAALAASALLAVGLQAQPGPRTELSEGRWTQEWSGEAAAAERVVVRTSGRVVMRGTDGTAIRYKLLTQGRASRGDGWVPVVFRESGIVTERTHSGTVTLVLRNPVCGDCRVEFELEIQLPRQTALIDLETRGGSIEVRGIEGSVAARTIAGPVEIDEIGGSVSVSSGGGDISLGRIAGPVTCETAGGAIEVASSGRADLRTGVGAISVAAVGGDLDAWTGAGSIEIGSVQGLVRATTGGGTIRVAEAASGMQANAAAGDIWIERASGQLLLSSGAGDIMAAFVDDATLHDSRVETSTGSIVISLPETLALTLDASIRLARGLQGIMSDFPTIEVTPPSRQSGLPGAQAAGAINGGGSVMQIRNGTGSIQIKRQEEQE